MKTIIGLIALMLFAVNAEAMCLIVGEGFVSINHRRGVLTGKNFYARVQCSAGSPYLIYWSGGGMCEGRKFYGRNFLGKGFSCLVTKVGYR